VANVTFVLADARSLEGLGTSSFQCVLLADFVEHVLDDVLTPALEEARRVLQPGGTLAIYTPNRDHWAERVKAVVPRLQQEDHTAVRPASPVVGPVGKAGFVLDELFFTASPSPLLGAVDRAFLSRRVCRFRTCLRARR